jgi:hypothetical protein
MGKWGSLFMGVRWLFPFILVLRLRMLGAIPSFPNIQDLVFN